MQGISFQQQVCRQRRTRGQQNVLHEAKKQLEELTQQFTRERGDSEMLMGILCEELVVLIQIEVVNSEASL